MIHIYNYLCSAKRKEEYKEFLAFTNTDEYKLVKHCTTRWLSLEKAVTRILQQWPALKSYFTSHNDVEKQGRVKRVAEWLNDPMMYATVAFLDFILPILNEFNTLFQVSNTKRAFSST